MKQPKPFAKEIDLCAAFIAALPKGWTAYAETGGWDILLVRDRDGFQIGIQAKLRLNVEVVVQTIEEYGHYSAAEEAPDCRAVLVPSGEGGGLQRISSYIGITIIAVRPKETRSHVRQMDFYPDLPRNDFNSGLGDDWHEWAPAKRHRLPEYVPDVAAGSSAPLQLTDWKIRALKLAVTLELRGYVVREDFAHLKLDHRRWLSREHEWLQRQGPVWVAHRMPDFKGQHPKVYAQIAADAPKWMRPDLALQSETKVLL